MTYDEFVYQHDIDTVYELIVKYNEFNQINLDNKNDRAQEVDARSFFI